VPKLWSETVEAHRRAVRQATLDTTANLVAERGLAAVTMTQVAEATGIGRATLYKYFPDVESILVAWHERQVNADLEQLARVGHRPGAPAKRLEAVLRTYALIGYQLHGTRLAALLHQGGHVVRAQQHLTDFVEELVKEAVEAGEVRDDVAPGELALYCLHALGASGDLPSKAATLRLVDLTLSGLSPR
jgi:AcrR family transcriptional regulator